MKKAIAALVFVVALSAGAPASAHHRENPAPYCGHTNTWVWHHGSQVRYVRTSAGLGFGPSWINFHRHLIEYRTTDRKAWVDC